MEDPEVLEEIRLLLNFQLNDAFLIPLLMVGTEALADKIRNSPLDQRIAARGILKPIGREDVHEYVAHRLAVAGRKEPVFLPTLSIWFTIFPTAYPAWSTISATSLSSSATAESWTVWMQAGCAA